MKVEEASTNSDDQKNKTKDVSNTLRQRSLEQEHQLENTRVEELLRQHRAEVKSLGLRQFDVTAGDEKSLKKMQLKVLTAMKDNMIDEF